MEHGIGEVQGDQSAARECYLVMIAMDKQMQTMSIEERMLAEPIEMLEDVPLDESNLEKFTKIGTSMEEKMKQELIGFLKQNKDVFAWSHEDMLGIDPHMITHRLNVSRPTSLFVRRRGCSTWKEIMPSRKKSIS